ncbi:MAG TPA: transposase [Gammaproteobacteria bacterium]|nr:transposase [Gammaproteobacteria bacterium]
MAVADCKGLPIAISIKNASPHEIKLLEGTLDSIFINKTPKFLIGDKAYDSDALDQKLANKNIILIAPNKCNRIKRTKRKSFAKSIFLIYFIYFLSILSYFATLC